MADITYLKGIRLFKKKDTQPEFVLATGVISLKELWDFVKENPQLQTEYNGMKQIKIQVLKSQGETPYITVDTFKPQPQGEKPLAHLATATVPPTLEDTPF